MSTVHTGAATSLYRYFDSDGELLYIGITAQGPRRGEQHRSKVWWPLVKSSAVEHFPDRATALAEEAREIRYWRPPYNTHHRPSGPPRRRRIPVGDVRKVLGRTSRAAQVADIDPLFLVHDLPQYRSFVMDEHAASIQQGETIQQFRERLKGSLTA